MNKAREAAQWSSIMVPSVQEMVKERKITTVPSRYIRSDEDKTEVIDDFNLNIEIPVIDMKLLCSSTALDSEVEKLDFACKEWGFFQSKKEAVMKEAAQWSSIMVPSVQEMVKEKTITTVPSRYIRSDEDKTEVLDDFNLSTEIPVIDMKQLCSSTAMDSEVEKLNFACKEWGFFQLVNHGIDSSFLDKVKSEIQNFFNLPMETKKKFWQLPNEIEGFGQAFVVSEDQKLDWADLFFHTVQPVELRKPHLFPKLHLPFRDVLETYSAEVQSLAKILTAKMAEALMIKPEEMAKFFDDVDSIQSMRMNYYPPCPQPDQVMGLTPHSDSVGLTILMQVNEVEGLQIKKDGKWVPVKPLPNAFVVNIGDILEIITNGTYRSIEHRGVVNSEKERLSIATFHLPGMYKEVGPAKSLVERQKIAKFKMLTMEEYMDGLFSRPLDGKAYLDALRI